MNTTIDTNETTIEKTNANANTDQGPVIPFFAKAARLSGARVRTNIRAGARKQEQNDK
jgi:hypothetical protein